MSNEISSRRIPWIALALSFLSAGVGHVYCGRIAKGLPLYFAWLLVPLGAILATFVRPSSFGLAALILVPSAIVLFAYIYAAGDAWRLARRIGSNYELKDYNRTGLYWLLILGQAVYSIGLIVGVRSFVYEAFFIPVNNMSPTVIAGDRVLARKLLPDHYFPSRGDLIVYRDPQTTTKAQQFMGRVVAVAGDEIEVSGDSVTINRETLTRHRVSDDSLIAFQGKLNGRVSYEENSAHRYLVTYGDTVKDYIQPDYSSTIPDQHVFVLGDNRDRSKDSRHFGFIHRNEIVGNVDYIYWPSISWSRFGPTDDQLP